MEMRVLPLTTLRSGYRTYAARGVVVACSIAALAVGCGPSTANLAGKVTIDGKLLPDDAKGTIYFAPVNPEAGKAVAALVTDSSYKASGVPSGEVSVTFEIIQDVGAPKVSARTGAEYQETKSLVPPDASGGLRLSVAGDNANQDFDL
jgi:hypothetical protein